MTNQNDSSSGDFLLHHNIYGNAESRKTEYIVDDIETGFQLISNLNRNNWDRADSEQTSGDRSLTNDSQARDLMITISDDQQHLI